MYTRTQTYTEIDWQTYGQTNRKLQVRTFLTDRDIQRPQEINPFRESDSWGTQLPYVLSNSIILSAEGAIGESSRQPGPIVEPLALPRMEWRAQDHCEPLPSDWLP